MIRKNFSGDLSSERNPTPSPNRDRPAEGSPKGEGPGTTRPRNGTAGDPPGRPGGQGEPAGRTKAKQRCSKQPPTPSNARARMSCDVGGCTGGLLAAGLAGGRETPPTCWGCIPRAYWQPRFRWESNDTVQLLCSVPKAYWQLRLPRAYWQPRFAEGLLAAPA